MTILITGGAGFIGSNLSDRLLSLGHNVVCFDNFDDFYAREIKEANISNSMKNDRYRLVEGDITNRAALNPLFDKNKITMVVHLAAKAGVRPSILDPFAYYAVNVQGTLNLLDVMKKHDVKKLVFASSSSVYGNNPKVPFSESDNVDNPISPYAATKKVGELLCHTYHHLYCFDVFCLRFFTVYGPRQRPDLAINKFVSNILNGRSIEMYGDGSTARDYTYIDDIVDGIMASIARVSGYEIINLGESRTVKLSHMISLLEKQLNLLADIRQLPMQPGDVSITYANIDKARSLLGYNPTWDFEDGIIEFLKWKIN
jgi:UDP-glucuronate 4-epimerase